jgi:hypothetical protein
MKKIIYRNVSLVIGTFLLFSSAYVYSQINPEKNLIAAAQVFPIFFERSDVHAILYIANHPEYEAIEAMISRDGPQIRVILTKHDQSQTDYVNDQVLAKNLATQLRNRSVHYSDIKLEWLKKELPGFNLTFKDSAGQSISMTAQAASLPAEKYGRLINPGNHSINSSLPLMKNQRSTYVGSESKVSFAGQNFLIPVKLYIPFFFKGLDGFYSEEFLLGGRPCKTLTARMNKGIQGNYG